MMTTARSLAAATVTTVLLAGCATASGAPPPATTGGYRLYAVDTQVGSAPISVIDAATGHLERTLPVGTPSPDWSRLYVLSHQQQKTTLAAVDTHRGINAFAGLIRRVVRPSGHQYRGPHRRALAQRSMAGDAAFG